MTDQNIPAPDQFPESDSMHAATPIEPLSVTDKFVGIFSEPSATYQNVRDAGPRNSDWLVPLFAFIIILVAGTLLRFANPEFLAQIKQQQIDAMQKQVETGKMTQQQAEQAMDQIDKFGGIQKIVAPIGAGIGYLVVFFLIVLIYWLLVRYAIKGLATYALMLSVVGLSLYIGIIDQLISILLMYVTGQPLATLSPTLFMHADASAMKDMSFRLAANLNPISIWSYFVVSIGIHKTANVSKAKAFGMVFGLWIAWVALSTIATKFIPGMG